MTTEMTMDRRQAQAALADVQQTYAAFREAAEGLDQPQGRGDGLLEAKVDRIAADLDRAQARLSALTRPQAGPGCEVKGGAGGPGIGAYLRSGQAPVMSEDEADGLGLLERKAGLSMGTTPGAVSGVLVPPETARLIEQRLMTASPMREIATVRTVSSGTFRKPISTSGVVAGWVSETAPRPETDPASLALMEFPTAELYAAPAATQALLDDSLVNLDEWLASEVEDSFAAQETAAFVSGDGVNKPKGFLGYPTVADASQQWGQIGFVASGAAGGFSASNPADRLIDLIYATRAPFRANGRFVMNRRTAAVIRKFKDASGDYIWQPPQALGQSPSLLGYPVTEIEQMPDIAANALALAFGDFAKGYLIVDRAGVSVLRDPYTAKPYVLFYTTKRVGGGVQNFDAIKVMRFSA